MAKDIGNPIVGTLIQQAFDLQGRIQMVVEESIVPTVSLGDLSLGSPPPNLRHATASWDESGVAGERFVARIEVPGNIIAVITRINFIPRGSTIEMVADFGSSFPIPTSGAASKRFTDERVRAPGGSPAQQPAGVVTTGTQVAALAVQPFRMRAIDAVDNIFDPKGWILGTGRPGQFGFIEFAAGTANVRIEGTIEWDEYQIF